MRRWLILSLGMNVAIFCVATSVFFYKGGWRWLEGGARSVQPAPFSQTALYQGRVDSLQSTPVLLGAWVFLGDSLTDYAPVRELFGALALNRGIAGDRIEDLTRRAQEASRHQPSVIVLWGGTNDVLAGASCESIVRETVNLVRKLKYASPLARVIVLGPPPVVARLANNPPGFNASIQCVNLKLREQLPSLAVAFGDPAVVLATQDGELNSVYSFDGVHLNGAGYRAWAEWLLPMLRP